MTRAALLFVLVLAGCTQTFEQSRPPEAFVRQSRAVLGQVDFTLFHVPSHGLLRDRQYVEAVKGGNFPDGLIDEVADALRRGADEEITVSVGGGSSEKTAHVVVDAFQSVGRLQLPGLDLLVILDPQHENMVWEAAKPSGCRVRFADLDD